MNFRDRKFLKNFDLSPFYYSAYKLTEDREVAKDIVNDSLVTIYNGPIHFVSEKHFNAYLFASVRNKSLNFKRDQAFEKKKKQMFTFYEEIEHSVESKHIEKESLQQIYSAIDDLPRKVREVATFLFLHDLSIKKVANLLDLSESSVRNYKKNAIRLLRARMDRDKQYDNKQNISKEKPCKLCLRVRNGKIEVIMEQSDGTWVLSDGTTELVNGLYVFQRSNWTVVLKELERLINKSGLQEKDLQDFFETYPELVLGDEYECVIPQASIIKDDKITWRADFVLIPADQLSFSMILELKLFSEKISLSSKNGHSDYSKKLIKAINQLRDYHQAFESDITKQRFKDKYQTEVFKPDLQLVFGRRNSIKNEKEFLELQRRNNMLITDWDTLYEKLKKKYS